MIEHRIGKGTGHMADAAVLRGRNMAGMFLDRRACSIISVTLCTVIHDTGMIENTVLEISANTMTDAAILAISGWMIRRHTRSTGDHIACTAVVARSTVTGNACVAENCRWYKRRIRMANVAILGCRQMACSLDYSRIIGNKLAGVTAIAATGNPRVYIRQEGR